MKLNTVGTVETSEDGFVIKLEKKYRDGLLNTEGFGHFVIVWWADNLDTDEYRKIMLAEKPYKGGPDKLGIFGTRSPIRPNPIAISVVAALKVDQKSGIIYTPYIDAEPGTPVLDIKPYTPSVDVVENITVPEWCSNWPMSIEQSASFDWKNVFNF